MTRKDQGRYGNLRTRGGLLYYHYDALGSVSDLTDHLGENTVRYLWDAFGGMFAGTLAPYSFKGITGKDHDPKSGLMFYNSRWYDPHVGRFTQPDSFKGFLTQPGTQHPYAYVGNNPINNLDPTGHYDIPTPEKSGLDNTTVGSDGLTDYTRDVRDHLINGSATPGGGGGGSSSSGGGDGESRPPTLEERQQSYNQAARPVPIKHNAQMIRDYKTIAESKYSLASNVKMPPTALDILKMTDEHELDYDDFTRHTAVQLYVKDNIMPGAELEKKIEGGGKTGRSGYADIVYGNSIWEVKPDKSWWYQKGPAQLRRYTENMPGQSGYYIPKFEVPYGDKKLVVRSSTDPAQKGMLYYTEVDRQRQQEEGSRQPEINTPYIIPIPGRAPAPGFVPRPVSPFFIVPTKIMEDYIKLFESPET